MTAAGPPQPRGPPLSSRASPSSRSASSLRWSRPGSRQRCWRSTSRKPQHLRHGAQRLDPGDQASRTSARRTPRLRRRGHAKAGRRESPCAPHVRGRRLRCGGPEPDEAGEWRTPVRDAVCRGAPARPLGSRQSPLRRRQRGGLVFPPRALHRLGSGRCRPAGARRMDDRLARAWRSPLDLQGRARRWSPASSRRSRSALSERSRPAGTGRSER